MQYGDFKIRFWDAARIRMVAVEAWAAQLGINVRTRAWWGEQWKFKSDWRLWRAVVNSALGVWYATQVGAYMFGGAVEHDRYEMALGANYLLTLFWFGAWWIATVDGERCRKVVYEMAELAHGAMDEAEAKVRYAWAIMK